MHIQFWHNGQRIDPEGMTEGGREVAFGQLRQMQEELTELENKAREEEEDVDYR